MSLVRTFTRRPISAGVLSLLILLAGLVAMRQLPVTEYPDVVPPTIVVTAIYPGASPDTVASTVAAPLEEQFTGMPDLLYQQSTAAADGSLNLALTYRLGTDMQAALVEVQNRIARAQPRLPEDARRLGITAEKRSMEIVMVVHLVSPDGTADPLTLSNYGTLAVRDRLAAIPGVGGVRVFGAGDYSLRIWLDPQALAARDLTPADVVRAVREQNAQIAAGSIGSAPSAAPFQMTVQVKGRLADPDEFRAISVRTLADGRRITLGEVARIELGAANYSFRAGLSIKDDAGATVLLNRPAAAMVITQGPGSNALAIADAVRATMAELAPRFPAGISYQVVYDPTRFISESIDKVIVTLLEAVGLVVIVVVLFLQTWRAALIPLLAVPVSIVGTFAVMHGLGYSINNLSLFGLVLAIGIVVDDAIVVVENVERHIVLGKAPHRAAIDAMGEVTGPIIATALVLCAVFIPAALVPGLTGKFYQQFAVTIAISTVISAINSLTLSPALSAILLRRHGAPPDLLQRAIDLLLGWAVFRPFNAVFASGGRAYAAMVRGGLRMAGLVMVAFAGLLWVTGGVITGTPRGFIPEQDKGFLMTVVALPDGSTLDRTESAMNRISAALMADPNVHGAVAFPGMGFGFVPNSSRGIIFIRLRPFAERRGATQSSRALALPMTIRAAMAAPDAMAFVLNPPPVLGLGAAGGFRLWVQDRSGIGLDQLKAKVSAVQGEARGRPELSKMLFDNFQNGTPQVRIELDRERAQHLGIDLGEIAQVLGGTLGTVYANDLTLLGRTWQVNIQAEAAQRSAPDAIAALQVRDRSGRLVPLSQVVQVVETTGPTAVFRYNGYPAIDLNAGPAPGYTGAQAQAALGEVLRTHGLEWEVTEVALQEQMAGSSALWLFPLCVLLVFLVLAALYESWLLPLAVILIVPLCILFALLGVRFAGYENSILVQIGLLVLVGLACKNAILIVEFARDAEAAGRSKRDAILEACRLRLRPILMTSIAFIAGVVPLIITSGAGAEMRQIIGTAVFWGMIGVTVVGLLLTPVFYHLMRALGGNRPLARDAEADDAH